MRFSTETLDRLPPEVTRPQYDRDAQGVGIVHFGIGAFHRAHQAWYTDLAMNGGERGWMIAGVSLRSATVAEQLNPQDGLYTLTERSSDGAATRLIDAVREVLVGASDSARIVGRIAAPECQIVSFTVTEKGYCRAANGDLDFTLAEASFYPLLAEGLKHRRDAGLPGVTLLSCDNLSDNGRQLERLVRDWLAFREPDLVEWFEHECPCPNSMIDRIVPASTEADLDAIEARLGLRDEGAVFTEPFSQWVIEDCFAANRPGWEKVGAQLVADVAPYETAKLRMLNGAHSALAYLGLEQGHTYVHEAVADPELRPLIERLMRVEAAESFTAAPGQDLDAYADELLDRFANSALRHRLIQIAMDGSEKIPQRWLETLAAQRERGRDCPSILTALSAWLRHVRGDARPVDDPRAGVLADTWQKVGAAGIAAAVLGPGGLLGASLGEPDLERVSAGL
jgi:fructuronate reductase